MYSVSCERGEVVTCVPGVLRRNSLLFGKCLGRKCRGLFVCLVFLKVTLLSVRKNISSFCVFLVPFGIQSCLFVDFGVFFFSPKAGFQFSFANVMQNMGIKWSPAKTFILWRPVLFEQMWCERRGGRVSSLCLVWLMLHESLFSSSKKMEDCLAKKMEITVSEAEKRTGRNAMNMQETYTAYLIETRWVMRAYSQEYVNVPF